MDKSPEHLAAWARLRTHARATPAVNVPGIAYSLGIQAILPDPDEGTAGRLTFTDTERIIYYKDELATRADVLTRRQRFTVAHELGHYLLAVQCEVPLSKQVNDHGVERFCDRFAEALLMPRDWLRRNWCDVAPSFREVERVSTLADVSMQERAVSGA